MKKKLEQNQAQLNGCIIRRLMVGTLLSCGLHPLLQRHCLHYKAGGTLPGNDVELGHCAHMKGGGCFNIQAILAAMKAHQEDPPLGVPPEASEPISPVAFLPKGTTTRIRKEKEQKKLYKRGRRKEQPSMAEEYVKKITNMAQAKGGKKRGRPPKDTETKIRTAAEADKAIREMEAREREELLKTGGGENHGK